MTTLAPVAPARRLWPTPSPAATLRFSLRAVEAGCRFGTRLVGRSPDGAVALDDDAQPAETDD